MENGKEVFDRLVIDKSSSKARHPDSDIRPGGQVLRIIVKNDHHYLKIISTFFTQILISHSCVLE